MTKRASIASRVSGAAAGLVALALALLMASPAALGQDPGTAPPAAPLAELKVWNGDILDTDLGAPTGGAPAIALFAPRNGTASGKVVVGGGPVAALKAAISELKSASGASIPAAGVRVRYGIQWDGGIATTWQGVRGCDILLEAPLPEFPSAVPVWVTVQVPKDAKTGVYSGTLTVGAKGLKTVTVPVKLDVQDWTLPDSQDWRTWVEVIQQPDTLALEYKLQPWSDRHWEMIARSLDLISPTGSRVINIPLIARTNYGNDETMVRWIKRPDGKYDYDFSLMEKYLDLVQKHLGKPKLVIFNVWEVFLTDVKAASQPIEVKGGEGSYDWRESSFSKALQELKGKGPPVTVVNPATKEANQVRMPRWEDPAAKALWKPVFDGIRQRMKARGLEGAMMLGQVSDRLPSREETAALNELSGGLPWASCSHHARWLSNTTIPKGQVQGIATVAYTAVALDFQYVLNPAKGRMYGWKKPMLHAQYWRFGFFNSSSMTTIRSEAEACITGNQRGVGHIGGDFWPCMRNKAGKRTGSVTDRYPESYWHSLNIGGYLLGPGQDGPVGTARLENFKEGIQECEARIAIETALTDPALKAKLGDELAKRAQQTLDERQMAIWKARGADEADFEKNGVVEQYRTIYDLEDKKWKNTAPAGLKWFLSSGWAERTAKLFTVAGEVQKKLGGR